MTLHRNAKLGLAGRFALVQAIEAGMSMNAAAAAFSVSPATAHRWWHRWREATELARVTRACLGDRSSKPHRSPRELDAELQERICACRRETGWGAALGRCGDRFRSLDGLEGAQSRGDLAARPARAGACQQL
jgi:transposase-like protein